ncbi:ADP-ribosylglycohydrolase [Murinocardiopsis flavida]|uniref:ADP-ribosylglycohydrolase n=1 Tax=Murinocardiopsis flavida TaxID=645275 RepID=A0A2P8CMS6_9ACTN|nr:ADP-ribosylglycohydrolase family protein [Murinocardiopsis flavida]PSK86240.1 ADP-ribosylglycohydrolase [Murinocardiopsis flavida]
MTTGEEPRGERHPAADRIRGAFAGTAIGDAAGWPSARHRFGLLAPWTRRLGRELDLFAEEHRVTSLPVPFALNQPVAPLAMGPSDDAEWLVWTALGIDTDRTDAFTALLDRTDLRARISVRSALDNLALGKRPPHSGHDNPHHFDDAAAVRAVAFGAAHPGDPDRAAERAAVDAEVTNSGDGVSAARAMAAAVAVAGGGGTTAEALGAGLARLPDGSAIRAVADEALAAALGGGAGAAPGSGTGTDRNRIAGGEESTAGAEVSAAGGEESAAGAEVSAAVAGLAAGDTGLWERARAASGVDPFGLLPALEDVCCDHVYSYGTAASATVPAAFALAAAADGALAPAVSAAACLAALADSAPALAGALTGALGGYAALAPAWRERVGVLAGCCLPELAGTDLMDVADTVASGIRSGTAGTH